MSDRVSPFRHQHILVVALAAAMSISCRTPNTGAARQGAPSPAVGSGIALDARLLAMTDQRQADTALVDQLLTDADATRRARAVLAIGQVKLRARYPALRRFLLDGDTAIAANAAFALGIARDSGAAAMLGRALAGAPDAVAREAAWALGELGEPARGVLAAAFGDGMEAPRRTSIVGARAPAVRAMAVLALAKLRPVPARLLLPWLGDPDVEVARAAAYVVGRTRAPAALRALLPLRTSADEETRQHVARALARSATGDSLATEAVAALRVLVRDSVANVRINAVRSLASHGAGTADVVLSLLRDSVANVRVATTEQLADALGTDTTRWRLAWDSDTTLTVRRAMLAQIRRQRLPLVTGVEARWATEQDWRYRVAALDAPAGPAAPGSSPLPRDSTLARTLLTDTDARVQRAARARLGLRDSARMRDSSARRERVVAPAPRPLADYEALVRRWVVPGAPQPRAVIDTDYGPITLELFAREAPLVVEAFLRLASTGRYRDGVFHRVVPNFVVQDGEIASDGEAPFTLRESWTRQRHGRGCLGLATAGPDTGGSQYYLCHSPQPHLDGGYTVFGRVIDGWSAMDRVIQGDRMRAVRVP
jgi:cyclophilin family peptidyl-prolyl cis-trans isomerase/HEAT repeat protein